MKKLYLITGFLGAGKTTFLQEIAKNFNNEKLAIIVNEYGAVGVDSDVLNSEGIESYEITNGSIFCVCRKDLFMDCLKMANDLEVDTIIVETSGLSDPLTSDDIIDQMKNLYNVTFDYRGIVALIDAKNFKKVLKTAICVESQVKSADLFVLNKCDLVDDLSEIRKEIIMINGEAPIIETTYSKVDYEVFKNLNHSKKESTGAPLDLVLQRKLYEFDGIIDFNALNTWLSEFKEKAYRIKGFVNTDKGYFNIEVVMGDIEFKPCNNVSHMSFLVVLYNAKQLRAKEIPNFDYSKGNLTPTC